MTTGGPEPTANSRTILCAGATGYQGRGFIQAVEQHNASAADGAVVYKVLALSRNAASAPAQELARIANVTVVQGDLGDKDALRTALLRHAQPGQLWGVFCVLAFPGLNKSADGEERQGMVRNEAPSVVVLKCSLGG